MTKTCEFCGAPAACYGGFPGAGSWAGWACDPCAARIPSFVWDRIDPTDHTWASEAEADAARLAAGCVCCGAAWPCPMAGLYPHRATTASLRV